MTKSYVTKVADVVTIETAAILGGVPVGDVVVHGEQKQIKVN